MQSFQFISTILTGLLAQRAGVILSEEKPRDDEELRAAVAALEHRGQLPPTQAI